jgi:hypothetical protein
MGNHRRERERERERERRKVACDIHTREAGDLLTSCQSVSVNAHARVCVYMCVREFVNAGANMEEKAESASADGTCQKRTICERGVRGDIIQWSHRYTFTRRKR